MAPGFLRRSRAPHGGRPSEADKPLLTAPATARNALHFSYLRQQRRSSIRVAIFSYAPLEPAQIPVRFPRIGFEFERIPLFRRLRR